MEEVLAAGRRLARAGYRIILYRQPGRPLPRGVAGPWAWPRHERADRIRPRASSAMTIAPAWGVSAAPETTGPLGRAGPWADEAEEIERRYGPDRTVHVSLEEFARTLSTAEENRERFREGGVRARLLRSQRGAGGDVPGQREFAEAFWRFRAFDRRNVLHLFASFERRPAFSREFPAAVQTGPLWPGRFTHRPDRTHGDRWWVWYASPASAQRVAPEVALGLAGSRPPVRLLIRSPRPWPGADHPPRVLFEPAPIRSALWHRRFSSADLRIVTGSRSLLEALEVGGRFLYFNGVLGDGAARRRHRPEKISELVALVGRQRWPRDLLRDLSDFALGRRVREVVRRAAGRRGGGASPPRPLRPSGFEVPFDDAGSLLLAVARDLAGPGASATEIVERWRRRSNLKSGRPAARGDAGGRRLPFGGRPRARRQRARAAPR